MNDIVFAGNSEEYKKNAQNFTRCLKVLADGDGVKIFGTGVPLAGEGIVVCIEQPLTPKATSFFVADTTGVTHAAEQAALYWGRGGGAILSALGELLIGYINESRGGNVQPAVKTLKEEIERCFTDPAYSVDASIKKLPLNGDYMRKLFKKEVGLTPHEYLTQLRMKRAKDLLLSGVTNRYSPFSVSQIAEACGFSEPLYFSRVFKKYYGVSPANYPAGK